MKNFLNAAAAIVLFSLPANAATINGDFSNGLIGWTATAKALNPKDDPTSTDAFVNLGDNGGDSF